MECKDFEPSIIQDKDQVLKLCRRLKKCTLNELIAFLETDEEIIKTALLYLENEGFIERENLEDDSRFNRIKITDKGKEIIENSYKIFEDIDSRIFEDFSEEEIAEFNLFLDKMQSKLVEKNEESYCVRKADEKQ